MRLQSVRIAGFKSFKTPTTVAFPGQFCAVVGPNGSGKSNIVDAVRWALGEMSARQLRGESMADVIFGGSARDKPLGQAAVELLLDNSDGLLGGQHAAYSEVSLRRAVSRDGQSEYRINGVACRRRDVLDMFRNSGLVGAHYAIVEQGMIGDIIEAKSEDLRRFLESAAGIAQYHARRRETERRMQHTQDNLARLGDLREELARQLRALRRQAGAARRYARLRESERQLSARLRALQWRALKAELDPLAAEAARGEAEIATLDAGRSLADSELRALRERCGEDLARRERAQSRCHELQMAMNSAEHGIGVAQQRAGDIDESLKLACRAIELAGAQLAQDRETLLRCQAELAAMRERDGELSAGVEQALSGFAAAEQAMHEWQRRWDGVEEAHAEELDTAQDRVRQAAARCAVLETWLAEMRDADDAEPERWLACHALPGGQRLAGELVVAAGWEAAVDTALAGFMRGVVVEDIAALRPALDSMASGALALLEPAPRTPVDDPVHPLRRAGATPLAEVVSAPSALRPWLAGMFGVDSLDQALAWRGLLADGESMLTRDGAWCGANWLRLAVGDSQAGPLRRQSELERALEERRLAQAGLRDLKDRRQALRDQLLSTRDAHRGALVASRQQLDAERSALHEHIAQRRGVEAQLQGIEQGIARGESQLRGEEGRRERWEQAQAQNRERESGLGGKLESLRDRHRVAEAEMAQLRGSVAGQEQALLAQDRRVADLARSLDERREPLQRLRLQEQRLLSEMSHLDEQITQAGYETAALCAALDAADAAPAPTEPALRAELERTVARRERIGNVNLAAAEDFAARSERKNHLDAQDSEMRHALEQLVQAMQKIDRESRSQLRDAIDAVNGHLQDLFPRLFGGGRAELRVGEGDLLSADISLQAQLPGKRAGSISRLSGGEKALTALALVFALFSVNPAPFCFLDEVDAALDDVNVSRFAELLRSMSSRVQIVCVTHNKATMQAADQLLGIAMREPGVSQVVSVDLESALELAGRE